MDDTGGPGRGSARTPQVASKTGKASADRGAEPTAALLAQEVRRLRANAELSHAQVAATVGYSRQYVSNAERVGKGLPSPALVQALDRTLHAAGKLVALRAEAGRAQHARRTTRTTPEVDGSSQRIDPIGGRQRPASSRPVAGHVLEPPQLVSTADRLTVSAVERYATEGPELLLPEVAAARDLCAGLPVESLDRGTRRRVVEASAHLSALMSYMAVNQSRYSDAAVLAVDASILATSVENSDLLAWVKGTQSLQAYYEGRYSAALSYAIAGLKIAGPNSEQRPRLLSNGVARAAARLGRRAIVDDAVEEALATTDDDGALGFCIGFGPYTRARAASNAVTAYVAMGEYSSAADLARRLLQCTIEPDDWSRSLIQLDLATALAAGTDCRPDEAVELGVEALDSSLSKPISSVGSRAHELQSVVRSMFRSAELDDALTRFDDEAAGAGT